MKRTRRPPEFALAILVSFSLTLAACAVNPATGKRQLVLISESEEVQLGRDNDKAIVAQFGLYEDEALQRYVEQLGRRMAARSERPDLDWTFRVLDDPLVNAFALPGGYIYITRGILAHFNNEAELASVLGHEIGHVTARHSVNQLSKAQLAQFGLGVGTILAPEEMDQFGNLAQTGIGLLFLKFGREDERQADDLGLRYLVRTGYDPRPMADVFVTLKRVGASSGGGSMPNWLSTHPDPENREGRVKSAIDRLNRDFSASPRNRESFFERIDGIVFGDDPRRGFFKGSVFHHPDMAFRLDFPPGWKTRNARQSVVGTHESKDALVQLTLAQESTAAEGLRAFLGQDGLSPAGSWAPARGSLTTSGSAFTATLQQREIRGRVAYVEHDERVFQLIGFSPASSWPSYVDEVTATLTSFRRETDRRVLDVQPATLQLVHVDTAMGLDCFIRRHSATVDSDTLAVINGLETGQRLQAGRPYKVVQGGGLP